MNDQLDQELREASEKGALEEVERLLKASASVHTAGAFGTALHYASSNGHEAVVGLLLEHGASVNARNNDGATPLHDASFNGHEAVTQQLLQDGASVNAKDHFGCTPLDDAFSNDHEAVARLLLEHGASVNAMNQQGSTPLDKAKNDAMRQLLLQAGHLQRQRRHELLHCMQVLALDALNAGHNSLWQAGGGM